MAANFLPTPQSSGAAHLKNSAMDVSGAVCGRTDSLV